MKKDSDVDTLIGEALENIRDDRKLAREFLNEIANQIAADADNNRGLSPVAAKHIETMQRSNEQLVKIANMMLMPGSYSVSVCKSVVSMFNHQDFDLVYYIALESDSKFSEE